MTLPALQGKGGTACQPARLCWPRGTKPIPGPPVPQNSDGCAPGAPSIGWTWVCTHTCRCTCGEEIQTFNKYSTISELVPAHRGLPAKNEKNQDSPCVALPCHPMALAGGASAPGLVRQSPQCSRAQHTRACAPDWTKEPGQRGGCGVLLHAPSGLQGFTTVSSSGTASAQGQPLREAHTNE